jgi:RimJ/RimL family protein N-acetyltransferase
MTAVAGAVFDVREARPDDAEEMIAFVNAISEERDVDIPRAPGEFTLTVAEERKLLADFATADNAIFLVAESDGAIIGMLDCKGGTRRALRHAAMLGMSVRRDWRNRGVGRALLARVIDWARGTGIVTRIELIVYARNARAIHLYESMGFTLEGRRRRAVHQGGEYLDDLIMALLL